MISKTKEHNFKGYKGDPINVNSTPTSAFDESYSIKNIGDVGTSSLFNVGQLLGSPEPTERG